MKKIIIVLIVIVCSCKSSKIYTTEELKNLRITDSLAKIQMQDLMNKIKEDHHFDDDDRDYNQEHKNQREE